VQTNAVHADSLELVALNDNVRLRGLTVRFSDGRSFSQQMATIRQGERVRVDLPQNCGVIQSVELDYGRQIVDRTPARLQIIPHTDRVAQPTYTQPTYSQSIYPLPQRPVVRDHRWNTSYQQPTYVAPQPTYVAPQPTYVAPQPTTYVISDNVDGAARAVRYFHSIGHRRIATITGLLDKRPGADRLRGYRQALQACGLAYRDEYVAYGDFYVESGRRAMADLLSLDEPPTAVFAASDMMALGAIRAVGDAGLNVPADVSVIGFDDIQLADHMNPPLTTVRQDKAGLGVAAGTALVRLIDGKPDDVTQSTVLPVELVRRGSTRPRAAT